MYLVCKISWDQAITIAQCDPNSVSVRVWPFYISLSGLGHGDLVREPVTYYGVGT